jgi:CheY-like chemotaxis protein
MPTVNSPPAILYAEDEENDVLLLRLGFKRARLPNPIHIAADGVQAVDYLAGNGPYADREQHPLPSLVLLDLNLPRRSGFEVLRWARQQPEFSSLPVVIYSSSVGLADKATARHLGATDFLAKSSDVGEIAELARRLAERWLAQGASP